MKKEDLKRAVLAAIQKSDASYPMPVRPEGYCPVRQTTYYQDMSIRNAALIVQFSCILDNMGLDDVGDDLMAFLENKNPLTLE